MGASQEVSEFDCGVTRRLTLVVVEQDLKAAKLETRLERLTHYPRICLI